MQVFKAKTSRFVKNLFPHYQWEVKTEEKALYLTFDDGPIPEITPWVLEVLRTYNAKATFFSIGNNIKQHPLIFQQILEDVHSVGNHTYNHTNGWNASTVTYINDFKSCHKQIANSSSGRFMAESIQDKNAIHLFRPPFGKIKSSQARYIIEAGYRIIMWDVLSYDWDRFVSRERCLKNVIENAENGSIIVFHDSKKAWRNLEYALPRVIKYFSERDYVFKSLT